ncbi:MAG: hypothetical protein IPK21_08310 [Haliscomenobacter sp.]|nr:hypothetical protein [Haliscomenobacter sp.]
MRKNYPLCVTGNYASWQPLFPLLRQPVWQLNPSRLPPAGISGLKPMPSPYLTGGYFAAGWAGKGLWRIRLLTADVNKPDWFTQKGFTNHHITAYAAVADRFLKPGWAGWWIGGGLVYWKSTIQTEARIEPVRFNNVLANGSLGYHLPLFSSIYLSPWAGLSLRIGGDQDVPVDQKTYTLPFLNPEASLKVGVFF